MRARVLVRLLVACGLAALAACRPADKAQPPAEDVAAAASPEVATPRILVANGWVTGAGQDARIRDAYGAVFNPMADARVVSVVPSVTETLFALGLGDSVVGVTTNCNYPPEAVAVEKVGDFNLNYEKIVSLAPTLVVGSRGFTDGARDILARSGIAYFGVSHASFLEIVESIHALGALLGAEAGAAEIVGDFNAAIARADARRGGRDAATVFWAQWNDPLSTIGPGNFHHGLIEYAGGVNVASDLGAPYAQFSEEEFAARDAEVVLTPGGATVDWVKTRFPASRATRTGRVYAYSSDASARPGPRVVEALDALSAILYPEAK
jgi:iron complex transport system substrate-binding protein